MSLETRFIFIAVATDDAVSVSATPYAKQSCDTTIRHQSEPRHSCAEMADNLIILPCANEMRSPLCYVSIKDAVEG